MSQRMEVPPPSSDRLHHVLSVGVATSNLRNAGGVSSVERAMVQFWNAESEAKINRFNVEVFIGPADKLRQMGSREQDMKLWEQYEKDQLHRDKFRGTQGDRTVMVLTVWGIDSKTRLTRTALHQNLLQWVEDSVLYHFPYQGNANNCSLSAGLGSAGVLQVTNYSPLLEPCDWRQTRASTMIYDYGYTGEDGTNTDNFLDAFFDASEKTFEPSPARCPPGPDTLMEPGTGIFMNRRLELAKFFMDRIGYDDDTKTRMVELEYEQTTVGDDGQPQKERVTKQRTIARVLSPLPIRQDSDRLSFSFDLVDETPPQLTAPGEAGPSGTNPGA